MRPENSRARPIQGSFTSHGALGLKGLEPAADRPASSASASLFFLKRSQQFSNPGKGANEAKGSRGCCCPSATEYPRGVVHQAGASLAWTRGHGHCQGRVCWFQTLQRPHASTQPFQPRPPRFCPLGRLRECGPQCPGCRAAPSPSQGAHRPAFPPQAHTPSLGVLAQKGPWSFRRAAERQGENPRCMEWSVPSQLLGLEQAPRSLRPAGSGCLPGSTCSWCGGQEGSWGVGGFSFNKRINARSCLPLPSPPVALPLTHTRCTHVHTCRYLITHRQLGTHICTRTRHAHVNCRLHIEVYAQTYKHTAHKHVHMGQC